MRICRPKAASEHSDEEDTEDTSDEEEIDENDSDEGEIRSSSEEQGEERQTATEPPYASETVPIGVTPFLSRVLPAGFLQAKRKPRGRTAVGLVQVRHRRGQGSGWAVRRYCIYRDRVDIVLGFGYRNIMIWQVLSFPGFKCCRVQ